MTKNAVEIAKGWRAIPGFTLYEAHESGVVRNRKTQNVLSIQKTHRGYWRVCLRRDGKNYYKTVHSIVLETFVGPRPSGYVGCHLNDNKDMNHLGNLKWGTYRENARMQLLNGKRASGETHGMAKLTAAQVIEIRNIFENARPRVLAKNYGVHISTIHRVVRKSLWVKFGTKEKE